MFKVNKDTRTTPGFVLVSLFLTLNIFHTFCVFIVNFEQVNAGWAVIKRWYFFCIFRILNKRKYVPVVDYLLNVVSNFGVFFNIFISVIPTNMYFFKVKNKNTRNRYEICSKLTKKHQDDFVDVVLVFLSLTLNILKVPVLK